MLALHSQLTLLCDCCRDSSGSAASCAPASAGGGSAGGPSWKSPKACECVCEGAAALAHPWTLPPSPSPALPHACTFITSTASASTLVTSGARGCGCLAHDTATGHAPCSRFVTAFLHHRADVSARFLRDHHPRPLCASLLVNCLPPHGEVGQIRQGVWHQLTVTSMLPSGT